MIKKIFFSLSCGSIIFSLCASDSLDVQIVDFIDQQIAENDLAKKAFEAHKLACSKDIASCPDHIELSLVLVDSDLEICARRIDEFCVSSKQGKPLAVRQQVNQSLVSYVKWQEDLKRQKGEL